MARDGGESVVANDVRSGLLTFRERSVGNSAHSPVTTAGGHAIGVARRSHPRKSVANEIALFKPIGFAQDEQNRLHPASRSHERIRRLIELEERCHDH